MITVTPPIRGTDKWGNGGYLASRGSRTHKGIDFACYPGSTILAGCVGNVTKIGFPYDPTDPQKGHLRYVQINDLGGFDVRYFYIEPCVEVGVFVVPGMEIGKLQDLGKVYPGITPHFHFEIKKGGKFVNPHQYFERRATETLS